MTDTAAPVTAVDALPAGDVWRRIFAMMLDPDATYTQEQMVWLVNDAFERGRAAGHHEGHRAAVDEANAGWPAGRLLIGGAWFEASTARQEWDRTARQPRDGDWPGVDNGGHLAPPWPPTRCHRDRVHRRHPAWEGRDTTYICEGRTASDA